MISESQKEISMTTHLYSKTELNSKASFHALTSYCEMLYIISFTFNKGSVIITKEKSTCTLTNEMIMKLPQYYLLRDKDKNIKSIGLRKYNPEACMNGIQYFTEVYDVITEKM